MDDVQIYRVILDTIDIGLVLDALHFYADHDIGNERLDYSYEIIDQLEGVLKNGD